MIERWTRLECDEPDCKEQVLLPGNAQQVRATAATWGWVARNRGNSRQDRCLTHAGSKLNARSVPVRILNRLEAEPNLSAPELSALVGAKLSTVRQSVSRLRRMDLVRKVDGSPVTYRLTKTAEDARGEWRAGNRPWQRSREDFRSG